MALKGLSLTPFTLALGLGAGAMFLFDPRLGKRRRAVARDKGTHYLHEAEAAWGKATRDLSNRTRGIIAETRKAIRLHELPRARSPIGFRRKQWTPAARLVGVVAGTGMSALGLRAGFPIGWLVGTAGLVFAARAWSNAPLSDLVRIPEGIPEAAQMAVAR